MNGNNTELYHYGVKGMKWGVRRYQNPDGSMTSAGRKQQAKLEAYRDKLVKKAQRESDIFTKRANQNKADAHDLKKYGRNSDQYKRWKEKQDFDRDWDRYWDIENLDISDRTKKYAHIVSKVSTEIDDYVKADVTVNKLIDESNRSATQNLDAAKRWVNIQTNLMNVEISAITSKRELKRIYESK